MTSPTPNRIVADAMGDDPLMTPSEIAEALRVDPKTVTRWANAGRLPAIKTPGGHLRVRRSVVIALLNGDGLATVEEMQPPPCADHASSELGCPACSNRRRAFYADLATGVPPNAGSAS